MGEPRIELKGRAKDNAENEDSEDNEDNDLALRISDLLRQNLTDHPQKRRDMDRLRGRVAVLDEESQGAVTLHFTKGGLAVHGGIVGIPDLSIRADSDWLSRLSRMELLPVVGLPDPRGQNTRAVLEAISRGAIRTHGALINLPMLLRLTRLMTRS